MNPNTAEKWAWQSHEVRTEDVTWRVAEAGAGATVLLLHGTGGALHSWSALLPFLAPHAHVVAVDLPGHGATSYPGFDRVTLREMTRLTTSLLRALSLAPRMVVGHSAGAAIMLQLAEDGALTRNSTLVGINAALQVPNATAMALLQGPIGDVLRSRPARAVVRSAGTMAPMIELLLSSTGSRLSPSQERDYVRSFTDPDHAEAAYAMMANWDLRALVEALPRITQRTLFIVGDRDAWVPPRVAADAASRMSNAQVATVRGAGHLVHEEAAPEVAALILEALRTSTPTS